MSTSRKIDQHRLKKLFRYNPKTGVFTRRLATVGTRKRRSGSIRIEGHTYRVGRLAWLWVRGHFPKGVIQAKNGIDADSRWSNIKETTRSIMKGGDGKGVYYDAGRNRHKPWLVKITKEGRSIHLGRYRTEKEAKQVRRKAVRKLFGKSAGAISRRR